MMGPGVSLLVALGCLCAGAPQAGAAHLGPPQVCPDVPASYLFQPAYCIDNSWRGPAVPYVPQPGDVLLATDDNRFWAITHNLAFAFEPHNSALIVRRCDGSLGVLEAGPNDTTRCRILPLLPHLQEYADKGPVWIRKRKTPLTEEQCAALTEFAERQDGKFFALARLLGQLTPFRSRGPLRTYAVGRPHGERLLGYYCAELVCESLVACGALDPKTTRPCATYPHDLFFDQSYNLYISHHLPLACDWEPPARWSCHP
jgi:hypothetical protein